MKKDNDNNYAFVIGPVDYTYDSKKKLEEEIKPRKVRGENETLNYEKKPDGSIRQGERTKEEGTELDRQTEKYIMRAIDSVLVDRKVIAMIKNKFDSEIGDYKEKEGYQTRNPEVWEKEKGNFAKSFRFLAPVAVAGLEGPEKEDAERKMHSKTMWYFDREEFLKREMLSAVMDKLFFEHTGSKPSEDKISEAIKEQLKKEYDSKKIELALEKKLHGVYENIFGKW